MSVQNDRHFLEYIIRPFYASPNINWKHFLAKFFNNLDFFIPSKLRITSTMGFDRFF